MPELNSDFQSLPEEYQQVLHLAQETHHITVAPLQLLVGGWSGAVVYLVSVSSTEIKRVEHCILKLDHKRKNAKSDEVTRHNAVKDKSTPEFIRDHIAELVFEHVEHAGAIAIFYRIAGQSLLKYRSLSKYERQLQLKAIFTQTNTVLLEKWNSTQTFEQAVHPQKVLEKWLGFRLDADGNIERFLKDPCRVDPGITGLLINGHVFPNPLRYARAPEVWGRARTLDVAIGFIHGDLNANNILVKFSDHKEDIEGYYLIDFALFKDQVPLLYDQRYLEMSYLTHALTQISFAKCVDFLTLFAVADIPDPYQVPIELSGVGAVIGSARGAFEEWVQVNHPSLHDDLWGQYWLAGVAAGLSYCHKVGMSDEQRLAGLIFAAANLKRYAVTFNLLLPTTVELLYDVNQFGAEKPTGAPSSKTPNQNLPSGTVTFLFTDIEGSTKISQQYSESIPALLARHHEILDQAIMTHHGFTFQIVADSYAVAFHNASDALEAALDIQRALHREAWSPAPIRVRMGIHTGAAQLEDDSKSPRYSSYATIATSQRIMSAGHGGQILLSQTTANLIGDKLPAGAQLIDLRERRLKDISKPVHLYQITAIDLPSDFPPLTTPEVINHNLPTQLTSFIGRKTELESLKTLLADDQKRLITIVAPGGMGKTRLSLEAAGQMLQSYPQGIYFVALDGITSAELIVQAVVAVLPISLASNEDPKNRILDYLRDRTILLVLDNFEHVLDGATFVQDVLKAAPRVQILVSSRVKLNLTAETIFTIEGLVIDEYDGEKNSALQLFEQSARLTHPNFKLNDSTLPSVTRICRMVDGMPLAILLAAAWIDTLAADEIASEIEKSIDMLETEKRDIPDRQRSVRAVIESSWTQVDAAAQNLLKRLSVFRGGFTRAAAQEAAGASLRGLSQLVDRALLRRNPETGRYSIHELLRQYAEEQLMHSTEEEHSAHLAHAKYFAGFMNTSWINLRGTRLKLSLQEIEADLDNIRVAWNYWTDQREVHRLLEFIDAMFVYFETHGSFFPAIQFFEDAGKKLATNEPDMVCARATLKAREAWFTALIGLPDRGLLMAQEAIDILSRYDQDISVETWMGLSINAIFLNRNEIVFRSSQEMLARAHRMGDRWEKGWALIWWAYALVIKEQLDEAMQVGQESLEIFESLNNPYGLCVASATVLGSIATFTGDLLAAKAHLLRGVQAAEEHNYPHMLQIIYMYLGIIALREKEIEQARQYFLKSLRIGYECGQTRQILASLRDLANVQIAEGNLDTALQILAVVLNHPSSDQVSLNRPERLRDEAEKLRAQIELQLDPLLYKSIWESSQSQPLADIVAQILA